ncbi:MAG: UvrD-helicase domain-containing protein [Bacilli bacterium]
MDKTITYNDVINNVNTMGNCYVIAPAGCGKTKMICDIANSKNYPVLLLTHTNAGVDAMKRNINNSKVKILTISSFVNKYVNAYKHLSELSNIEINYDNQYNGFIKLLDFSIIKDVLTYNYQLIFIDEFQDCTIEQCNIINKISEIIPVKVFGDEMQAIFNFKRLSSFNDLLNFKPAGELNYPWRWKDNLELGKWTIKLRSDYANNFENAINNSNIIKITEDYFYKNYYKLLDNKSRNCIITKIKLKSINIAQRLNGYFVLEELELKDLKKLADNINTNSYKRILELLVLLKSSYVKSRNFLYKYIEKIKNNDFNFKKFKDKELSEIIFSFCNDFSKNNLKKLIIYLHNKGCRLIRFELVYYCYKLLDEYSIYNSLSEQRIKSFFSSIKRIDKNKVIAHTLLIKGLEYDNCVVFKEGLTVNELYVAYTRAKNKLYIIV